MNKNDVVKEMIRRMGESMSKDDEPKKAPLAKTIQARVLLDILAESERPNPFKAGDFVEQAPHRQAYTYPQVGELAIVRDLLVPEPKLGKNGAFQREDMTILCQIENRWVEFSVESWRFEKYEGDIEK